MRQRDAVESWWFHADDFTRERAIRLDKGSDLLPEDMAVELMMSGVTVTTVATGDGEGHVIPEVVSAFLDGARELRTEH